ncbi:hypothetical protein AB0368_08855 [Actinoplanes sp. NPDC051475]|uniref:hypothetical protein n=1 Tax=Actinoplanes sp. NPDC051475 TaxID=3157225 RepID=UPI00344F8EC7
MRLNVRNVGPALVMAGALTAGAVFVAPTSGYAGARESTQPSQPAARAGNIHFVGPIACAIDGMFFGRHEFFTFINIVNGQALPSCLADAGKKKLGATRANFWRSGNNAGKFRYKDVRGRFHTHEFKKHQADWFDGKVTVEWIRIY